MTEYHLHRAHPDPPAPDGDLLCTACAEREPRDPSYLCGACFAHLGRDISTLVGAHTWLGVAMLTPTPAWKPGTIHRAPAGGSVPFPVQLLDARTDIAAKLTSWARVIAEEHAPALAGPADAEPATVARWMGERLRWAGDQPWAGEMARELAETARAAYALAPWNRHRRDLPLPCPGCGYLTLSLYGGNDLIACRFRECSRVLSWPEYWAEVRKQHGDISDHEIKPSTSTGAAA